MNKQEFNKFLKVVNILDHYFLGDKVTLYMNFVSDLQKQKSLAKITVLKGNLNNIPQLAKDIERLNISVIIQCQYKDQKPVVVYDSRTHNVHFRNNTSSGYFYPRMNRQYKGGKNENH